MEQKNRFLSLGIALGLIAGTAAGVLVDLFTGWTFSISMAPAWACSGALSSAPCSTSSPLLPDPGISHRQQARKFL